MECDRTSVKYWRKFGISMECDRTSVKYCRKNGKSPCHVTEHQSNTAEKWEISMECDRTSVRYWRKIGISMEYDRRSVKYCKNGNTAGQDVSFAHTSREPMIQLQYTYCAVLSYIHDSTHITDTIFTLNHNKFHRFCLICLPFNMD
jgi:hypothetical protein